MKQPSQILLETFVEECLEELDKQKHLNPLDLFNNGLGSADAAIRRVKLKGINKLEKQSEDVDSKIF